jgi:uncharacterized protein
MSKCVNTIFRLEMKRFLVLAFFLIHLSTFAQKSIPELWGLHVHDEAHMLTQQTVDQLETQLKVYEDSTSNQIAILIISSLEGEILEEYTLKVAEKWKLGNKEKDNGALLLIAVDDHKMRIETGIGLEGVLTDAVSNRIIRNEIAPAFRKSNYDEGVIAGINAIIKAIGGEYKAEGDDDSVQTQDLTLGEKLGIGAIIFGVLGIFTFIGLFAPGCAGWFLYVFLIPFYAIFPMVVFGTGAGLTILIIYAIAFPILKMFFGKTAFGKKLSKGMGNRTGGGGWTSGGGWFGGGGGGWSSGGGGGGFSGGGGSFGGGGSSGSW